MNLDLCFIEFYKSWCLSSNNNITQTTWQNVLNCRLEETRHVAGFLVFSFVIFKTDIKRAWPGRGSSGVTPATFGRWRSITGTRNYWTAVWRTAQCPSTSRSRVTLTAPASPGTGLKGDDGRWAWSQAARFITDAACRE